METFNRNGVRMLRNKLISQKMDLGSHGFLVGVEVEDGVDLDYLVEKLAGALTFVEGTGKTEVEYLGLIDTYDEDGTSKNGNQADGFKGD